MNDKTSRPGADPAAPPVESARAADHDAPVPSASILQGRDMITIEHNGRLYQLRRTRQGKLILTK